MLLQIRESTKASLQEENDPATVLHLTSLLLFYASTGHMLNAPGKFVPHVLTFLRADLRDDTFQKLLSFQSSYQLCSSQLSTIAGSGHFLYL